MTLASVLLLALLQDPVTEFLKADEKSEKAALDAAVKSFKGNFKQAFDAVRAARPLSSLGPGVHHDLKFKSGTMVWDYSIRLPKDYDGTKRFPVLVLPDHASVGAAAGISFWEQDTENIEKVILFRPVIIKHREDASRFPDQKPTAVNAAVAGVMKDALVHLRLHYAADADRLFMTGLSQAGFYTWYFAVSLPDQFAAIVPESSGGTAVPLWIQPLAGNVKSVAVRILHTKGDAITPYEHAELMADAVRKAGAKVELTTYTESDYSKPNEKLHPGPHDLRLKNVLPWVLEHRRELVASPMRVLWYPQQGLEGRFRILPPADFTKPRAVTCREEKGELSVQGADAFYQVSAEDMLEGRQFVVNKKKVKPKPDVELLLRSFKSTGDLRRLAAAEIPLKP
jgi:poly(3-hydroxybutyrate) depolymerase